MICDSNIIIYAANPNDDRCGKYLLHPDAHISSISRIEVLGFPRFNQLEAKQQERLIQLVRSLPELTLDEPIIKRAIDLRKQKSLSLGDSIIAATALENKMPLVTRNVDDYKHIEGIRLINPFE